MKKKNKKVLIGVILAVLIVGALFYFGTLQQTYSSNVKLAIPHFASFKCQPIGDVSGQTLNIPKEGALISSQSVGFYTNKIQNINAKFTTSFLSTYTTWSTRFAYQICDVSGNQCGTEKYYGTSVFSAGGVYNFPVSSLDVTRQSLRVRLQVLPVYLIGGWQNTEGLQITFDSQKFGLALYDTTQDPAGKVICQTSCNLDCPDIGYRQKILFTNENKLGFYQTAPYLEYWESIDYDLNKQGGATIYNSATNTFCFAGTTYTGKTLKTDGGTYIYPDKNTKKTLQCCPGAVISSTYSDQVCQNDGTWKTIQDTDKLTCTSDINCPNAGNNICQSKQLSSGYRCVSKDSNNVGICQKSSGSTVECCTTSDCNTDQTCDIGGTYTCKGGSILPTCGDGVVQPPETCDDGNTISGDGCSTTCQKEHSILCGDGVVQAGEQCDDGNVISGDGCSSTCQVEGVECPAWISLPGFLGGGTLVPDLFCLIDNLFSPIKWILAILGGLLAGALGFKVSGDVVGRKKKNQWIPIVLALALAGAIFGLIFIYFWWGVVTLVILGIIKGVIPRI